MAEHFDVHARGHYDAIMVENNGEVSRLMARVTELEKALQPFAAAVVFCAPSLNDEREIMIAFQREEGPASTPTVIDAMPTVATVGDVRRAARALGLPIAT